VRILLCEFGAEKNSHDRMNNTPLNNAALCGHTDVVYALITEFGCDPQVRGYLGDTPLHNAAQADQKEVARELITRYKCPVDCRNKKNETPLHKASYEGHLSVVRMLLSEFGADVNSQDSDNDTPLHIAVLAGHENIAQELISRYKCPVDCKNKDNETPLHYASSSGHLSVARMLLSHFGAHVNSRGSQNSLAFNVAYNVNLSRVTVRNSSGFGLYADRVFGNVWVYESAFLYNTGSKEYYGGNARFWYGECPENHSTYLQIESSYFLHGNDSSKNDHLYYRSATGLTLLIQCPAVTVSIKNITVVGNQAENGSEAILPSILLTSLATTTIMVQKCLVL